MYVCMHMGGICIMNVMYMKDVGRIVFPDGLG